MEYRIQFDDGFHPTRFQLITERGESTTGRVCTDNANSGGSEGDLTVNTYTLDLENEENREAVLETMPFVAASQFVSPALPVALLTTDNPLSDRLTENSVEYEQHYDTEGDTLAAQTPTSGDEVGEQSSGFGIGGNDETARRTLTSTRYRDNSQPDAVWQDADCSDSGSSDDD